ncbi:MAG TPA: extracellular solute-binding protein, partial [Candidatus Manganitrophaceae bacterium]|nr:extracellular solute-binding protein [Candidatus Manganitrophaceae bacterium]
QSEGSPVRGKVGVAPLPAAEGHAPASALGGWLIGINRQSRHPEAAGALVHFLTSPAAQKSLALRVGYKPARMSLYHDRELRERDPFLIRLEAIFRTARPRPVTPYYLMLSQIMQPEFSAAITGVKSPEAALRSAALQMNHLLE